MVVSDFKNSNVLYMKSIKNAMKESTERIEKLHVPYENEFRSQLQHLSPKEKEILQQFIFAHEWNLGSSRVLALFQTARITTATEYVLRLRSRETIQQVMNDLLEVEHVLLADLISNSYLATETSTTLKEILQESFNSVLDDFLENPDVIPCNYLSKLKSHLTEDELSQLKQHHLQLLLAKDCSNLLEEVIGLQERWQTEHDQLSRTTFGHLLQEIVQDTARTMEVLFEAVKSHADHAVSWKHFLSMLHMVAVAIGKDKVEIIRIKGILKDMFAEVVNGADFGLFLVLILAVREICSSNEQIMGNYSSWYKATLGEMSYRVTKEQFIQTMEMMNKLVPLEKDSEMLKVHILISISTPPKCMELVVNYKQLCRAQLVKLENDKLAIVVDDD